VIAEARQEGIDLSDAVLQRLPAEVGLANQLIEKRAFSWTKFLTGLEQAIPPRLVLSSVRLEQGGTMVHLLGSAVSLEDITAFTVGLQDHPTFKDPVLAQHRVGTNGLVEFDVTLRYSQAGL
jgi:Tfp pilus assembly protein PilN